MDQRAKVCFIFHNATVKLWRVLYQVTIVLYETSKLNTVYLCMERSHLCKHHLEGVNIPETVNNSIRNVQFSIFRGVLHKQTTVNGERFAELYFHGFHSTKFFRGGVLRLKHLNNAIVQSLNKYSRKNFHSTLKNHKRCESLSQKIVPCLQYI